MATRFQSLLFTLFNLLDTFLSFEYFGIFCNFFLKKTNSTTNNIQQSQNTKKSIKHNPKITHKKFTSTHIPTPTPAHTRHRPTHPPQHPHNHRPNTPTHRTPHTHARIHTQRLLFGVFFNCLKIVLIFEVFFSF